MVIASKNDDVIYHWLSKIDSRNESFLPKSSVTRRKNSLNMKHVDNSCEIRNKGNRSGKYAESIDNMSSPPRINYTRVLPFSDLQQSIAGMNGNKEARGTLSGVQCRNDITESERLTDTHKKVYEDEDAKGKLHLHPITYKLHADFTVMSWFLSISWRNI